MHAELAANLAWRHELDRGAERVAQRQPEVSGGGALFDCAAARFVC